MSEILSLSEKGNTRLWRVTFGSGRTPWDGIPFTRGIRVYLLATPKPGEGGWQKKAIQLNATNFNQIGPN
jgi:hypothetical protein